MDPHCSKLTLLVKGADEDQCEVKNTTLPEKCPQVSTWVVQRVRLAQGLEFPALHYLQAKSHILYWCKKWTWNSGRLAELTCSIAQTCS